MIEPLLDKDGNQVGIQTPDLNHQHWKHQEKREQALRNWVISFTRGELRNCYLLYDKIREDQKEMELVIDHFTKKCGVLEELVRALVESKRTGRKPSPSVFKLLSIEIPVEESR